MRDRSPRPPTPWLRGLWLLLLLASLWFTATHLSDILGARQGPPSLSQLDNGRETIYRRYGAYRLFLVQFSLDVLLLWFLARHWPRGPQARRLPAWATRAVKLVFVLAALATLEVTARSYHDIPLGPDGFYKLDPVLGWRLRPLGEGDRDRTGEVAWEMSSTVLGPRMRPEDGVNRDGLRNPPVPRRPAPGELRILCLGDSCTYGVFLSPESAYPARLQEALRARYPDRQVTVLNAGTPGYNSVQGLTLLRYHLRFQPDLVLWSFASNDTLGMPYQPPQDLGSPLFNALRDSHFYGFLRVEVQHRLGSGEGERPAPAPSGLQRTAAELLGQARDDAARGGAKLGLVLFPDADLDGPGGLPPSDPPRRPEELRFKPGWRADYARAAAALGVPVLDPIPAFKRAPRILDLFIDDHYHVSDQGGRLMGEEIAAQLGGAGLVP